MKRLQWTYKTPGIERNRPVYTRIEFDMNLAQLVKSPVDRLLLSMKYDDGELSPNARSYARPISLLEPTTVKARVRHQAMWSALTTTSFIVDHPLAVTEIMYHSATQNTLEFIELKNTSTMPMSLNGVRLDGLDEGVEFAFSETLPLPSGEYIVVVRDRRTFARAYDTEGKRIANGQFEQRTALFNVGELITLRASNGRLIQQFVYQDHRYRKTDGGGHSLVIVDTTDDYEKFTNWRRSLQVGGSPRGLEPVSFDANLDGVFDFEDFVCVFQIEKFGTGEPASWSEGDWDGDGDFDHDDLTMALRI